MVTADIQLYKQGETGQCGVSGVFMYIVPVSVQFSVDVSSGNPTAFHWDFGDGSTSDIREPLHTYSSYGIYRVVLTVSDSSGSYVSPFYELRFGKLDFSADTVRSTAPLVVHFTEQSVAPSGCHFTGAIWDFGDGFTGMVGDPTHVYPLVGKYTVSLRAYLSDV
jgi:PKD repeat protein